jgi:serine/threonine protein kinase
MTDSQGNATNDSPNIEEQVLVNRYKILERLGSGGMGTVYKARDLVLKRFVAVKVLKASDRTQEQLVRLQREARAICQLQHPNIIDVFDFIVSDTNVPLLAMEYVEGESLEDLIKRDGPLQSLEAIEVCEQISAALTYAHARHIMHRDLKPANVIVAKTRPMQIKIIDFGIAKLLDEDGNLTSSGVIMGTPSYISPEQAQGEQVDYRSDIYSLGCLMYRILTGKPVFRGATLMHTLHAQIHELAPTLREGNPAIEFSEQLEEIVAKTLEKNPNDRYQSMNEVHQALTNLRPKPKLENETESASTDVTAPVWKDQVTLPLALLVVLICLAGALVQIMQTFATPIDSRTDEERRLSEVDSLRRKNQIDTRTVGKWVWHYFDTPEITDERLNALLKCDVTRLTLSNTNVKDEQLETIAKLPLVLLDIRDTNISNKGVEIICQKMPKLQSLIVENCPQINSEGYRKIARLTDLKILSLRNTSVSDDDLIVLSKLKELNLLYVAYSPKITDRSIDSILKLEKLYSIRIDGTRITDKGINRLSSMPRMIFLGLGSLHLGDENFPSFSNNISMLDLNDNPLSARSIMQKVLPLPDLWYLNLIGCQNVNNDQNLTRLLTRRFAHAKARVCLLDQHEGIESPEGYLDPALYRNGELKQFTFEERKATIDEAVKLFRQLEKEI